MKRMTRTMSEMSARQERSLLATTAPRTATAASGVARRMPCPTTTAQVRITRAASTTTEAATGGRRRVSRAISATAALALGDSPHARDVEVLVNLDRLDARTEILQEEGCEDRGDEHRQEDHDRKRLLPLDDDLNLVPRRGPEHREDDPLVAGDLRRPLLVRDVTLEDRGAGRGDQDGIVRGVREALNVDE